MRHLEQSYSPLFPVVLSNGFFEFNRAVLTVHSARATREATERLREERNAEVEEEGGAELRRNLIELTVGSCDHAVTASKRCSDKISLASMISLTLALRTKRLRRPCFLNCES